MQPVGKVPLRSERSVELFETVRVDCCAPWTVKVQCRKPQMTISRKVHTVMMIDDAKGWLEITQLDEKTAHHLAKKFDAQWSCRYLCPKKGYLR